MNMPYNTYEIERARLNRKLEEVHRERLASLARLDAPRLSLRSRMVKLIHHHLTRRMAASQEVPPMNGVIQVPTEG